MDLHSFFDRVHESSISDIEVINYIEKITDNYKKDKIELLIRDLSFYISVLENEKEATITKEEIEEAYNNPENEKYITQIEIEGKIQYIMDYEPIFYPHYFWGLKRLQSLLKSKIIKIENKIKNKYPQYFSDYGYSLFVYLNEKYESKNLKTKYSNIFHFFKYCDIMECTQLEYIEFIKTEYQITLSKILEETFIYSNSIQPKLLRFKSEFDKIN